VSVKRFSSGLCAASRLALGLLLYYIEEKRILSIELIKECVYSSVLYIYVYRVCP